MIEEINEAAMTVDEREHVCPDCRTVHWTPTGKSFCD
jgi:hypothetical protein